MRVMEAARSVTAAPRQPDKKPRKRAGYFVPGDALLTSPEQGGNLSDASPMGAYRRDNGPLSLPPAIASDLRKFRDEQGHYLRERH